MGLRRRVRKEFLLLIAAGENNQLLEGLAILSRKPGISSVLEKEKSSRTRLVEAPSSGNPRMSKQERAFLPLTEAAVSRNSSGREF